MDWTIQQLIPDSGRRFFCSPEHPDGLCSYLSHTFNGFQALYPWEWLGHESCHSPPSTAKVKNGCAYAPASLYCSIASTRTTLLLLYKKTNNKNGSF
jgi:hypothetical protein